VRIVHWILAQLVEAVHSQRTDTLRERIGEFTSLVPMEGFITLRECRRKRFSETYFRQICLLEPRLFELYEHAPPNGGPLSVRIKREVWMGRRKLGAHGSVCPFGTFGRGCGRKTESDSSSTAVVKRAKHAKRGGKKCAA
jgi:hypothetical protein